VPRLPPPSSLPVADSAGVNRSAGALGDVGAATPVTRPRAYGGRTADERMATRRARFIGAGFEVFGRVGLRGATVRGVCAQAGLIDRYFYESFDSLERLFQAVLSERMARLHAAVTALDERPWASLQARAAAGYAAWFEAVADPRDARVVLIEPQAGSAETAALVEAQMQAFAALNTAPMKAWLPAGRLSPAMEPLIGRALVGAAIEVARQWAAEGHRRPQQELVQACVLVALGTLQALAGGLPP